MSVPTDQKTVVQEAKSILGVRQQAYQQTFSADNMSAQLVLSDLAKYCRAGKSTFDSNSRTSAFLQGRKDVYERIQKYMQMTPEQLWDSIRREGK